MKKSIFLIWMMLGLLPITGRADTALAGSMTTQQFEAAFQQKIKPGGDRNATEQSLRGWGVHFKRVEKRNFGLDNRTKEPPTDAWTAIIGLAGPLERTATSETFVSLVIFFDKADKVLQSNSFHSVTAP